MGKRGVGGHQIMPVCKYGQATSATAAAALVFSVPGLKADAVAIVSVVSLGTGPAYVKTVAVTANTITVTMDAAQSAGSTVINYICFEP